MSSRRTSRKKSSTTNNSRRKSKGALKDDTPVSLPYRIDNETPISDDRPDYSQLKEPLSVKESRTLVHSLEVSRNTWLSGRMFEKYWSRPPRGRKLEEGEVNAREKMTKLCECCMAIGPHFFDVKLFICKDESGEPKEDPDEKLRLEVEARQRAYEEARRRAQEEHERRAKEEAERSANAEIERRAKEEEDAKRQMLEKENEIEKKKQEELAIKKKKADEESAAAASASASAQPQFIDPSQAKSMQEQQARANAAAKAQNSASPHAVAGPINRNHVQEPVTSVNNQVVIARLQALARNDPALNALMQTVASGTGSLEQMSAFQIYIQRARNTSIPVDGGKPNKPVKQKQPKPPKPPKPPKIVKIPKPPTPLKKVKGTYNSKKNMKDVMIVFEFKDNPADRYILPRESIVEVLSTGVVLISFILVHNKEDQPKKPEIKEEAKSDSPPPPPPTKPQRVMPVRKTRRSTALEAEIAEPEPVKEKSPIIEQVKEEWMPIFTAMTITMREVPRKCITMIERSVTKRDVVYPRMEDVLKTGSRARDFHVWYQIEKSDAESVATMHQPARPPSNMIFPARKREYKPRPKKEGDSARKRKKSDIKDELGDDQEHEIDAADYDQVRAHSEPHNDDDDEDDHQNGDSHDLNENRDFFPMNGSESSIVKSEENPEDEFQNDNGDDSNNAEQPVDAVHNEDVVMHEVASV